MLSLEDINKLPHDPTQEDLIALGLLPKPAPPPSIIPALGAGEQIPKTSPVKAPGSDTSFRTGTGVGNTWQEKLDTSPAPVGTLPAKPQPRIPPLAPLAPVHPNAATLPPISPVTAPEMGGPTPGGTDTGLSDAIATGNVGTPQLPKLNFKERQALPTTSEGVAPNSKEEALAKLMRLEEQRENPWGSAENHPGKLGKIAHYLARIGNIAGDIVAPAVMANIPGTELNKAEQEGRLKREIAGKQEAESEQGLRGAEAEEARARARKLGYGVQDIVQDAAGNAVGWQDADGGYHTFDEEGTPPGLKGIAEKWQGKAEGKPQKENLEQGLAGAVQEALDNDRDPKTDTKVQGWAQAIKDYKPSKDTDVKTAEDLKHRIVMAMESGDVAGARQLQAELNATDPEGMARLAEAQARFAETRAEHQERKEEREEKQGLKWVTGEVPGTHQTVTVPFSQAKAMNLENQAEAGADHVNKVLAARVVVPMLFNNDPADQGILQLVDQLDKNGDLGVVASRWNDLWTRKIGADPTRDQLFTRLRTKLDLAQTKMMQAHVGNRGGAFMLEHFEDLANAGKLNADTLRAAVDTELRYMDRNAEKPRAGAATSGGIKAGGHNFTINGKQYANVPDDVYERAKKKPGFKE